MGGVLNAIGIGRDNAATDVTSNIRDRQLAVEAGAAKSLQEIQPQQSEFAKQLAAGALGQGPSIADAQMKQAMERNLQQQMAVAMSQRGVSPALAQRNASMGAAKASASMGSDAAIARLQEQRNQQNAFQNYLSNQQNYQTSALGGAANTAANIAQIKEQQRGSDMGLIGGLMQAGGTLAAGGANKAMGGVVEGAEVVPGDSEVNDIHPHMLSAGEVVLPKTVVEKGPKAAANFLEALQDHINSQEKLKKMSFAEVVSKKKGV